MKYQRDKAASFSETNVTDIELMPDGRIYVFGTSREVLEVLNLLQPPTESGIRERLQGRDCGGRDLSARQQVKP